MPNTESLPPLYADPVALNSALHGSWRITDGSAAFAASLPFIQIVLAEIIQAARSYPILFTGDAGWPVALLGLEENTNLFIEDDRWVEGVYVPAYTRRYPFVFISTSEEGRYALGVDRASDRIIEQGEHGTPLFEDGKPAEVTQNALQFCEAYHAEVNATNAFWAALKEHDLLVDRQGAMRLADGRVISLQGFKVIDAGRLAELDADVVAEWHRNGWLAAIYAHLASLDFQRLLSRANRDTTRLG